MVSIVKRNFNFASRFLYKQRSSPSQPALGSVRKLFCFACDSTPRHYRASALRCGTADLSALFTIS
jgi:hypothetical protein